MDVWIDDGWRMEVGWIDVWMDRWMDGQMDDGWIDGQTDGWMTDG